MQTWFLTKNFLATIYLSLNSLTVLTFDYPIDSYFLGTNQDHIYSVLSKDKRSLVLKGLKKTQTNLFVKTNNDQFTFDLKTSKQGSGNLLIKRAKRNQTYKLIKKNKDYSLYEGNSSLIKVYKDAREELLSKI